MKGLCSRTKSCHQVFGYVFYSVAINTDDFRSLWAVSGEFVVPSNGRCVIAGFRIALEVNCYLCTHLISPSSNDQRHKHSAISNPCSIFNHRFLAVYQHTPECVKRILTFWYPNYFGSWKRMTQLTSLRWNSSPFFLSFGTANQTNLAVIINVLVTILKTRVYNIQIAIGHALKMINKLKANTRWKRLFRCIVFVLWDPLGETYRNDS